MNVMFQREMIVYTVYCNYKITLLYFVATMFLLDPPLSETWYQNSLNNYTAEAKSYQRFKFFKCGQVYKYH